MQQINLYQPIFRKQKKVFTAVAMLQVTLIVILILAAFYAYSLWSLQPFQEQIARTTQEQQRLSQQIASLEAQTTGRTRSQLLEDEVKRLRNELANKRQVQTLIESGRFGKQSGFSSFWEGLARQQVNGLWLTYVRIAAGGQRLTIRGKTISAELVPVLIQKLSAEPAFAGLSFNVLEMTRSQEQTGILEFNLSTTQDTENNG